MKKLIITAILGIFFAAVMSIAAGAADWVSAEIDAPDYILPGQIVTVNYIVTFDGDVTDEYNWFYVGCDNSNWGSNVVLSSNKSGNTYTWTRTYTAKDNFERQDRLFSINYWYNHDWDPNAERTIATKTVTLVLKTYDITYDANGGSGTMAGKTVGVGDMFTLPACTFTPPAGKVFDHWEVSGADGIYAVGNNLEIASNLAQEGVITVTAHWKDDPNPPKPQPEPEPQPAPAPEPVKNEGGAAGIALPSFKMKDAKVSGNSVKLSWSKFPYADKFTVFMTIDGVQTKLKTTTNNSLTVKGLKNGVTYRFMVTFTVGTWTSPESLAATATVTPYFKPLVSAKLSDGNIRLGWKGVPDAEGYLVYKLVDGKLKQIAETAGTSALITNAASGKEYVFAVSAIINGEKTGVKKSDLITVKL